MRQLIGETLRKAYYEFQKNIDWQRTDKEGLWNGYNITIQNGQ